jgi:hypothetical protein
VQSLFPLLLYVAVGEAEQPLPPVSAGVVHTAHGQVAVSSGQLRSVARLLNGSRRFFGYLIYELKYIIKSNKGLFL